MALGRKFSRELMVEQRGGSTRQFTTPLEMIFQGV